MTRIERLTERAITFAIAEPNEDLAVSRLAFLPHGDNAALDAAIDACLPAPSAPLYPAGVPSASWAGFAMRTGDLRSARWEPTCSLCGSGDLADRHQGGSQADRPEDLAAT
jgi:hypothetical protein